SFRGVDPPGDRHVHRDVVAVVRLELHVVARSAVALLHRADHGQVLQRDVVDVPVGDEGREGVRGAGRIRLRLHARLAEEGDLAGQHAHFGRVGVVKGATGGEEEEFYVSEKRFLKAEEAREKLARVLGPEGVIVERVILGEHHFHPDYEKVIHDKKLAEQTAERMVSEGHAAQQEALRNLETAKGQVSQKIAAARGSLDQVKLHADADYFRAQREA